MLGPVPMMKRQDRHAAPYIACGWVRVSAGDRVGVLRRTYVCRPVLRWVWP